MEEAGEYAWLATRADGQWQGEHVFPVRQATEVVVVCGRDFGGENAGAGSGGGVAVLQFLDGSRDREPGVDPAPWGFEGQRRASGCGGAWRGQGGGAGDSGFAGVDQSQGAV